MIQDFSTPAAVRARNLSLTLNLIRERGMVTRAEIIEHTQLSGTTISSLVNVLIASDFVSEAGIGVSSGGRRPVKLEFNYNVRYVLGVDMGASHITAVIMNLNGKVVASLTRPIDVVRNPTAALEAIRNMVFLLLSQSGIHLEDLLGVGATVPAPLIDDRTGRFLTYYMPAWAGVLPADEIRKLINLPVYIENDANAAAVAEKWWGSGRAWETLAYIKIGTGVGSGLILNNEIYRGFSGTAGEIGHSTIEADGRLCRCGNHGCMESYVGIPGFLQDARKSLMGMSQFDGRLDSLTVSEVIQAAKDENPAARQTIASAGRYLGIGIANLINLFNPGIIILGGDLVAAGDYLMDSVRASVNERTIPFDTHKEKLILSELGSDAVAIGAATIVIQHSFNEANLYQTLRHKF